MRFSAWRLLLSVGLAACLADTTTGGTGQSSVLPVGGRYLLTTVGDPILSDELFALQIESRAQATADTVIGLWSRGDILLPDDVSQPASGRLVNGAAHGSCVAGISEAFCTVRLGISLRRAMWLRR